MNGKDREEFGEFMAGRWPGLVRLGYALTGDRWLAEDLAQTALVSACSAWWRVRRADDPDAYVRRILINASNRRFRRRRPAEAARGLPEARLADPAGLADQRSDLMTALRGLPPRQRAVIVLRYWGDQLITDHSVAVVLNDGRPVLIPGWRGPREPCRFPGRWPGPILAGPGWDVPRPSLPGAQPPHVP